MCLSFFFGCFVRTSLGRQDFHFVCARETKKRVKHWPDHFLCATYNTWTDFLSYHVWAIYICGCFQRYWISLDIDESASEVDIFVIVDAYRDLFLVPPKSTRIISLFCLFLPQTPWGTGPTKGSSAGTVLGQRSAEEVGLHITSGSAALKGFAWFHWSRGCGHLQSLILFSFILV